MGIMKSLFLYHTDCSAIMLNAQQLHDNKQYADALALSCELLEKVSARRLDLVVLEAVKRHDRERNQSGCKRAARITRSETGIRFTVDQEPQKEDSQRFIELAQVLLHLPAPGLSEKLYVLSYALTRQLQRLTWHPERKRRPLRIMNRARHRLLRHIPTGAGHFDAISQVLSLLFREPERTTAFQLREHTFFSDFNYSRRLLHLTDCGDQSELRQQILDHFNWPEQQAYERYVGRSGSRVLLTIHMGDFVGAFNRIARVAGNNRRSLSLRRDRTEHERFAGDSTAHEVLYHADYNALTIVSALRRGDCTLSALFDLKEEFGETIEVSFFNCPSRFVKGPAQLAIMGRAPIIPFVTYEENDIQIIEMESSIDTQLQPQETLAAATQRITQTLVNLAERWIRNRPAQWKFLPLLPGYLQLTPVAISTPQLNNEMTGNQKHVA